MIKSTTNIFSITLNPKSESQYYPYPRTASQYYPNPSPGFYSLPYYKNLLMHVYHKYKQSKTKQD